jgi:transposase-like protein
MNQTQSFAQSVEAVPPNTPSPASQLSPKQRKELAITVLARTEPVTDVAQQYQVSRKFLYQQAKKADTALETAFL